MRQIVFFYIRIFHVDFIQICDIFCSSRIQFYNIFFCRVPRKIQTTTTTSVCLLPPPPPVITTTTNTRNPAQHWIIVVELFSTYRYRRRALSVRQPRLQQWWMMEEEEEVAVAQAKAGNAANTRILFYIRIFYACTYLYVPILYNSNFIG